ncbi:hypothetical protein IVG45_17045 [Methylomonas sp. LL1]|uniref:hypothetical protein n=1 Tax=Methylomonas sp. LL1 TaxID=2785785 RepID=UPI0018C42776|nr:hypothetical protein [Methylomonas sp. LL1]QPK62540.1 hypothetical protein IVG45_17045 [Methylomonas sp. LL1]
MDSYLNIVSLALAIAALVPVLLPSSRVRFWTITAALISGLILITTYQMYKNYEMQKEVVAVEEEIWSLLTDHEKGLTFEQIYNGLYHRSLTAANQAIDTMVKNKKIFQEMSEVSDPTGNKYVLRKFFRRFGD